MTDKPILFSAPMVRALLEGRKTMTRRIIKPRPYNSDGDTVNIAIAKSASLVKGWDGCWYFQFEHPLGGPLTAYRASYASGERLWVREAWRASKDYDAYPPRELSRWPVHYEADGPPDPRDGLHMNGKLRPSMFMPRWASRLTLTVTDVKVERLQDISEDDAWAEGVENCGEPDGGRSIPGEGRELFQNLWSSINGPDAWTANPWVAATSFTVRLGNIDETTAPVRG